MPEKILALTKQVSHLATSRVDEIRRITRMTKILSVNASIEAARAGASGSGFAVVAESVGQVSADIETIAERLHVDLGEKIEELNALGHALISNIKGSRLADLALNMIDIIDRNLYERSCDVRWWAMDSAVVAAASGGEVEARHACQRLAVILDSYTVYLDLWIADRHGKVVAHGRLKRYSGVLGTDVSQEAWFRNAMATRDGTEFVACDIARAPELGGMKVATYSTAIRAGGETKGGPIGALGIFFDWQAQSQDVVDKVRLTEAEKKNTKCLILDSQHRVIANSVQGDEMESYALDTKGQAMGSYVDRSGKLVGFSLTPGYETYKGLGWYGVLLQAP